MSAVLDLASWILLAAGGMFCIVGGVGMLRMPDFYTRLHAAGGVDTLGAGLIVFGLALQAGLSLAAAKLIVVALLILFTSPTATHALAQAALGRGLEPLIAQEKDAPSKP
jgi:multicomponent Na+:H+ antiporter subunit G